MWSLLLLATVVATEDLPTPSSLLRPKHYNHHPEQYLKEVEPTKQGPVLFPNDGPPPPRTPLIVTSRPLAESIARSELNPNPIEINNSIASPSQINRVSFKPNYLDYLKSNYLQPEPNFLVEKPNFLARVKDYKPFVGVGGLNFGSYGGGNKVLSGLRDSGYGDDYGEPTASPPIFKFSDHAKHQAPKIKNKIPEHQTYHVKDRRHDHGSDYDDDGSNYAFSYRVKDHKTGDDFSHTQQSSGSATNGEYRVRLPDGRMQIVSYTADENGYKADVRYDDEQPQDNRIDNFDYHVKHNYNQDKLHYDTNKLDYDTNKLHYDANIKLNDYNNKKFDYDINKPHYDANINDYGKNKFDYDANKHHYDANINDFDKNNFNYDKNKHHYDANLNDYGKNKFDYDINNDNHDNLINDYQHNDYSDVNHDYVQNRNYKPVKEPDTSKDYQYSDLSKEVTDYSAEYDGKHDNYEPHKSKFSSLIDTQSTIGTIVVPSVSPKIYPSTTISPYGTKPLFVMKKSHNYASSTVRPTYEELKPLFVTKKLHQYNPVEINVPSTTPQATHESTTEHVVVIGAKPLYTNIRGNPGVTPTPSTLFPASNFVTPRHYLVSTIDSLKNGQKPILSDSFINRINKYLTFN